MANKHCNESTTDPKIELIQFLFASMNWLKTLNEPPKKELFIKFRQYRWKPQWQTQRHRNIVDGYIKSIQLSLHSYFHIVDSYFNIADLIKNLIASYYFDAYEYEKVKVYPEFIRYDLDRIATTRN